MTTLYTAFKGANNTSFQLVSALNKPHLLLTNSFAGVERDIAILGDFYDSVIMLGVDKTLCDCIRFEKCAEYSGKLIRSAFDIEILTNRCDALKIPYSISSCPTKYLCNAAYWHTLQKIPNAVFIHIPSIGKMHPDFMQLLIKLLDQ